VRYKKAPILEAVLEFRWQSTKSMEDIELVLSLSAFEGFEKPKRRMQISASFDGDAGKFSHEYRQLGF